MAIVEMRQMLRAMRMPVHGVSPTAQLLVAVLLEVLGEVQQEVDLQVLQPVITRVVLTRVQCGVDQPVLFIVTCVVLMAKQMDRLSLKAIIVLQQVMMN